MKIYKLKEIKTQTIFCCLLYTSFESRDHQKKSTNKRKSKKKYTKRQKNHRKESNSSYSYSSSSSYASPIEHEIKENSNNNISDINKETPEPKRDISESINSEIINDSNKGSFNRRKSKSKHHRKIVNYSYSSYSSDNYSDHDSHRKKRRPIRHHQRPIHGPSHRSKH